jgi:isopentenyl diphosphate isomerase/L-lactate dehydrogenase-like FMN-dependent dehydrogenase
LARQWNGQFRLKGVMSAADARRAVETGCAGIVVDAVGDRIDLLGGILGLADVAAVPARPPPTTKMRY